MKPICFLPFLSLLLLAPASVNAAGSMLRINCEGDDIGAEVLVNGKFRGECPIDLQVPAGTLKLLVRKKGDAQRERASAQEIRMGEGAIKKIEINLEFDTLKNEAAAGNPEALYQLWRIYAFGKYGVPANWELSLPWLRKAAAAGHVDGMLRFANLVIYGHGVPKDEGEALRLYHRAAEKGAHEAMFWLGHINEFGLGVPKNKEEAAIWYGKAMEGKSPLSDDSRQLKEASLILKGAR